MRRQGLREECGKGDTHFPNHQGADAAPRSPRCSRPAPGSGCSCPAARPPSAHLRVTSLRERWPCAGPEGILVWFSPGRAYPMFMTMPAAPAWALPPVHTTQPDGQALCSPAPGGQPSTWKAWTRGRGAGPRSSTCLQLWWGDSQCFPTALQHASTPGTPTSPPQPGFGEPEAETAATAIQAGWECRAEGTWPGPWDP